MAAFEKPVLDQPLRAVTYGRVSRDPTKRGTSVADQQAENKEVCEENGWVLVQSFEDIDRSASRHARGPRPGYEAMVKFVQSGEVDIIVVWEASRAYRNLTTYAELRDLCERTGIFLSYKGRVYDMRNASDREHSATDAVRAEAESDAIRDRVRRTTKRVARNGKPHGRVPFGYRRAYDIESGDLLRQYIYEPEAEVIREIARRVAAGHSSARIAKDFNERGVSTPTGSGPWTRTKISAVLLKPTNAGQRQFQGKVIGPATWDPIVDQDLYDRCEAILKSPARRTNRDTTVKHLLSGIARCSCGAWLRRRLNRGTPSYVCVKGAHTSIPIVVFDAIVVAEVLARMERPEFAVALTKKDEDDRAEALRQQITDYTETLDEATEAVALKRLSVVRLSAIEERIQPLLDAAEEELRALACGVPATVYEMAGSNARTIWAELDLEGRRDVLRTVTTLVQLNRVGRGRRGVTPDRYDVNFRW